MMRRPGKIRMFFSLFFTQSLCMDDGFMIKCKRFQARGKYSRFMAKFFGHCRGFNPLSPFESSALL